MRFPWSRFNHVRGPALTIMSGIMSVRPTAVVMLSVLRRLLRAELSVASVRVSACRSRSVPTLLLDLPRRDGTEAHLKACGERHLPRRVSEAPLPMQRRDVPHARCRTGAPRVFADMAVIEGQAGRLSMQRMSGEDAFKAGMTPHGFRNHASRNGNADQGVEGVDAAKFREAPCPPCGCARSSATF